MAKEYIEKKETLIKYLRDKQVALENIDCINMAKDIGRIIRHIEQDKIPTADVVEVVWCCNCIHLKVDSIDRNPYCDIHSTKLDKFYVRLDDYCSYGERRK